MHGWLAKMRGTLLGDEGLRSKVSRPNVWHLPLLSVLAALGYQGDEGGEAMAQDATGSAEEGSGEREHL
jgi:hypothetical protein